MVNFKILNATDTFLEMVGGSYAYKYKGKEYEVTPELLDSMDRAFQQSFGSFAAKHLPKQPPKVTSLTVVEPEIGQTYLPEHIFVKKVSDTKERIRKVIMRWAKTEKLIEEKLNYPRVFQALLTEPHNAFEYKRKTPEDVINLTLFIDTNMRYHIPQYMEGMKIDSSLHNTMIEVASTIKGVTVFSASAIHGIRYKDKAYQYYTDLLLDLPPDLRKKVMVFSQGCGRVGTYLGVQPKAVTFCTPFAHRKNCGCPQIRKAEEAEQNVIYKVRTIEDLEKIP